MRFFKVRTAEDKREALLIYRSPEIRRLKKCLPETEESNTYINLKTKLNKPFRTKEKIHYAQNLFLKTTPIHWENILLFAIIIWIKQKPVNLVTAMNEYWSRLFKQQKIRI